MAFVYKSELKIGITKEQSDFLDSQLMGTGVSKGEYIRTLLSLDMLSYASHNESIIDTIIRVREYNRKRGFSRKRFSAESIAVDCAREKIKRG